VAPSSPIGHRPYGALNGESPNRRVRLLTDVLTAGHTFAASAPPEAIGTAATL
jgi:hypothetical protein